MYAPTKNRLKEISDKSLQITQLISQILSSSNESMNETNVVESNFDLELTPEIRRSVLSAYNNLLSLGSQISSGNKCVDESMYLIWYWFNSRFILNKNKAFKYNIQHLHTWIENIVILIGYHITNATLPAFKINFIQWCDELSSTNCSYAVPYDVYRVSSDVHLWTLCSVVLWDLLMNDGYSNLAVKDDKLGVYLKSDGLYRRYLSECPDVLDDYCDPIEDPSVLKICKLI